MNQHIIKIRARLAGVCLIAVCTVFLPAASAFWETESAKPTVSGNAAPTAEPVQGETFSGVMIELPLSAADPDGDAVLFKLIDRPAAALPRLTAARCNIPRRQIKPAPISSPMPPSIPWAISLSLRKSKSRSAKTKQNSLMPTWREALRTTLPCICRCRHYDRRTNRNILLFSPIRNRNTRRIHRHGFSVG